MPPPFRISSVITSIVLQQSACNTVETTYSDICQLAFLKKTTKKKMQYVAFFLPYDDNKRLYTKRLYTICSEMWGGWRTTCVADHTGCPAPPPPPSGYTGESPPAICPTGRQQRRQSQRFVISFEKDSRWCEVTQFVLPTHSLQQLVVSEGSCDEADCSAAHWH